MGKESLRARLLGKTAQFQGPAMPNPNKTRDQMFNELEDWYSVFLHSMSDDEIDREYGDKIG